MLLVDVSVSVSASDARLLAGLRAGDERAFVELVECHGGALLRYARTFVHGTAAEDVVQETWLAVVTGIERFEGRAQLRTWLYAIVANRARTHAARERRSVPFSALAAADDAERLPAGDGRTGRWAIAPAPPPDAQLEAKETLALLDTAIDALPPVQGEVVRLRDVEGWESGEVCAALHVSAGNQRVLLHRGRAVVRAALEAHLSLAA